MKYSTLLHAPLLSLTALLGGCNFEVDVDAAELREEFEQGLIEVRSASSEVREELLQVVEEQQAEFAQAIRELRQKLEEDEELRNKLREKRANLERLITKATNDGGDAWEETRAALLDACEELGETLREFSEDHR